MEKDAVLCMLFFPLRMITEKNAIFIAFFFY